MERWKQIDGHEDYLVSSTGKVVSLKRGGKTLKVDVSSGYPRVTLSKEGVTTRYTVHRLVALAFIDNPAVLPMVNHIDGNTANNHVSNLEWCTCRENTVHAFKYNLRGSCEKHSNATRKNAEIHEVCALIESGLKRAAILKVHPNISKACFDDIRSRRTWVRISKHYKW